MSEPERFDLARLSPADVVVCGSDAVRAAAESLSLEDAADRNVHHLYNALWDPRSNRPGNVLVRFYRTIDFADLEPSLQNYAALALGPGNKRPAMKCLTLMGTAGDVPQWNSRQTSVAHRAIPLTSRAAVERMPMVSRLIRDLGMSVDELVDPPETTSAPEPNVPQNVFYIRRAESHPSVPDQDFVRQHGVQSVVAVGGPIDNTDLWAIILFSRVEISPEVARLFRLLAVDVKIAVMSRLARKFFAAHPPNK